MPKLARLYLDTARLGLMSPSAQLAARDFARLAGEGVSTLYWQRFFREGYWHLEPHRRAMLPGLAKWHGIDSLKEAIRRLLHVPPTAPVYVAGRTTALFRSIVQVLWGHCRSVLVADTLWSPYRQILDEESARLSGRITIVPLRREIVRGQLNPSEAIAKLSRAYVQNACDGIVLSSVSHDGIRLPVADLLAHLRQVSHVKLAVIDGAQELAHLPVNLASAGVDVYLAGCHKWLGAHLPLGVCCLPRSATSSELREQLDAGHLADMADPLFSFVSWLGGVSSAGGSETVNALPLVCAAAALHDILCSGQTPEERFAGRLANHAIVDSLAVRTGWMSQVLPRPYRTGILLLQSQVASIRRLAAEELQARFDSLRVTVTAMERGSIRLALPGRPLTAHELSLLEWALALSHRRLLTAKTRPHRQAFQAQ